MTESGAALILPGPTERGRRVRRRRTMLVAVLRYPVLLLTHVLARPLIWLLNRLGLEQSWLRRIGRFSRGARRWRPRMRRYRPGLADVLVCTYFKCGTNWTMQIAHQVATRGRGEFEHVHDVIPWPDTENLGYAISPFDDSVREASPTGLRVIKTHAGTEHLPLQDDARYIYVVRDPKDAFVSGYHFLRDVSFGPLMPTVPIWLEYFLSEDYLMESWAGHVAGYWRLRDQPNLLMLSFKEMKRDLPGTVRRVADFMGVELTAAELDAVCMKSSFEYMKNIDGKFRPSPVPPLGSKVARMIRKGRQGGSSEMLTPEQQRRIDAHFRAELRRLGCDLPYDTYCSPAD